MLCEGIKNMRYLYKSLTFPLTINYDLSGVLFGSHEENIG